MVTEDYITQRYLEGASGWAHRRTTIGPAAARSCAVIGPAARHLLASAVKFCCWATLREGELGLRSRADPAAAGAWPPLCSPGILRDRHRRCLRRNTGNTGGQVSMRGGDGCSRGPRLTAGASSGTRKGTTSHPPPAGICTWGCPLFRTPGAALPPVRPDSVPTRGRLQSASAEHVGSRLLSQGHLSASQWSPT